MFWSFGFVIGGKQVMTTTQPPPFKNATAEPFFDIFCKVYPSEQPLN